MKQSVLISYIFIFISFQAHAQKSYIDSLVIDCAKSKPDTNKVNILNDIAYYYSRSDFNVANNYADSAIELSANIQYTKGKALGFYYKGETFIHQENYKSALVYYFQSLSLYKEQDFNADKAYTEIQIGNVYYLIYDYKNAMKYYKKAHIIFDSINHNEGRSVVYNNYANLQTINKVLDSAILNYERALMIDIEQNNINGRTILHTNIGRLYVAKNMYESAFGHYEKAIELCGEIRDNSSIIRANHAIGDFFLLKNKYEKAEFYLTKASNISDRYKLYSLKSYVLYSLSKMEMQKENYKTAYEYLKHYDKIKDSISNAENIRKATLLELSYEFDKQRKEEEIEKIKIGFRKKIQWTSGIAVLIILLFVVIFLFYFQKQKIKKNNLKIKNLLLEYKMIKQDLENESKINNVLKEELSATTENQQELKDILETKNREIVTKMIKLVNANETINAGIEKLTAQKTHVKGSQLKMINETILELKQHNSSNLWHRFELSFQEVHNDFYENLLSKFPHLTQNDLKLCAFLKLQLSSKEIAAILNLNPSSVEVSRSRLRKKLDLTNIEISIFKFLQEF